MTVTADSDGAGRGGARRRPPNGRLSSLRHWSVIAVPYLWLLLFFLIPFVIVLKISLSEADSFRAPPYLPMASWADGAVAQIRISFANFRLLLSDSLYVSAYIESVTIAFFSTLICLAIGYPMAYGIARSTPAWRSILLLLVILPFWTSFLIRIYAWMGILRSNGLLNEALLALGVISEPLRLLNTDFAVYLGIVYSYLPFMILPLYAQLEKLDGTLLEAAADLGCRPWQAFLRVTLPMSLPGVLAGCMLVFIPAVGEFVIPELLGGPDTLMIGKVLWTEFSANNDWPLASAVAATLLMVLVLPIALFQMLQSRGVR